MHIQTSNIRGKMNSLYLDQLLIEAAQVLESEQDAKRKYRNQKKAERQARRPQGKGRKKGKK